MAASVHPAWVAVERLSKRWLAAIMFLAIGAIILFQL